MSGPSKQAIQSLFSSLLKTSKSFSSYNFREYFVRRTTTQFQKVESETDPQRLQAFYDERTKELEVLKRAAVVNSMYGGRKLVVETPEGAKVSVGPSST